MGAQNMPKSTGGLMPQNTGELCDNCDCNSVDSLVASGSKFVVILLHGVG